MKILLVDDEIIALHALQKRVDWMKYGFAEVFTAQDAACASEILLKNKVDMMLCDIEMPGESGLELTEYVRLNYPDTICVMVTCHSDFSFMKKAMKLQVTDYILKPIDYEELDALLTQFSQEAAHEHDNDDVNTIVVQTQELREKPQDVTEERLNVVKKYIEDHIREKIYVEDLAKLVHVNPQHLMRIFKRETGKSLTEYMTERRIVIASNLLKNTDYSINFISDCIGCENYSYFTKLFKRYSGFTPKEYRMQFKKK